MLKARPRGRPPVIAVPKRGARVVKKYGNRRLYDTRASRYITLDELLDLFAVGELRVLDASSGEDLTERTLSHGLIGRELVPREVLRALARYRRGARRRDLARHLLQAVAAFERR
jgi:polyhydroxyalkanoate synthesis repressor PhaR